MSTRQRPTSVRKRTAATVTPIQDAEQIRWSRVLAAQARVASGYYDRPDVQEFILDAVIDEIVSH
jgi:hypothetical protein